MADEEPPSVSGALACGLRDVVLELVGGGAVRVALSKVPPGIRRSYESMTPVGWVPIEYNRGRLEAAIPAPGRAEIRLFDWADVPDWPLRATRIGVETVLRLAGRKHVRVMYERSEGGALYVATFH